MITGGYCNYLNGTRSERIGAGSVVLMNPGDTHACNPLGDDSWSYIMIGLLATLRDPGIDNLEKQGAAVSYFGLVQRSIDRRTVPSRATHPRLGRAAEFIKQNCQRSLTLDEICAAVNCSASHLTRAFREVYGLTPHAYQTNCRIEFCRSQLRSGRPSAEIAAAAGFADQAHMQRSFKKIVAATPGRSNHHQHVSVARPRRSAALRVSDRPLRNAQASPGMVF